MELEGFGTSLVGCSLYVHTNADHAWVPMEFLSNPFSCKLLVTGSDGSHHCVEAETTWTAILRPVSPKDWSCIATLIRGAGPGPGGTTASVLLTFDTGCPVLPESFAAFLDAVVAEGRISLTRVWIGFGARIPTVPDAVFFPPSMDAEARGVAHALIGRLPARNGHGAPPSMSSEEWASLVTATATSGMGICVTDVGENGWTLFWHKPVDSAGESREALVRRGLAWMRTGGAILEKYAQ